MQSNEAEIKLLWAAASWGGGGSKRNEREMQVLRGSRGRGGLRPLFTDNKSENEGARTYALSALLVHHHALYSGPFQIKPLISMQLKSRL